MSEEVGIRLTKGQSSHGVLSQGRKRKRSENEHAYPQQRNGFAQKSSANNHGTSAQQRFASLAGKKKELLSTRQKLPIWPHAENIRQSLRQKDVMLLVGETGSGKSTQVPQFLLTEKWCKGCIAVTQPRRVAAISLARRVAEEMGTPLGSSSPASKVGYSVRFDTSVSPNTKIKFLTEGMLLQELLRDPSLKQYSAVIVDEVHERSVNVDLILGFLRNLVRGDSRSGRNGEPLKVAVMSATADVQKLYDFFENKRTTPLTPTSEHEGEGELPDSSKGGLSDDESLEKSTSIADKTKGRNSHQRNDKDVTSICYVEGRQYPVQTTYLPESSSDFVEAALAAVFRLHASEALPGDILVFLTGQDTVETLERLINEYAETLDKDQPKVCFLVHTNISC
jgi:ATP-dependent RNA helicase DHR2